MKILLQLWRISRYLITWYYIIRSIFSVGTPMQLGVIPKAKEKYFWQNRCSDVLLAILFSKIKPSKQHGTKTAKHISFEESTENGNNEILLVSLCTKKMKLFLSNQHRRFYRTIPIQVHLIASINTSDCIISM